MSVHAKVLNSLSKGPKTTRQLMSSLKLSNQQVRRAVYEVSRQLGREVSSERLVKGGKVVGNRYSLV